VVCVRPDRLELSETTLRVEPSERVGGDGSVGSNRDAVQIRAVRPRIEHIRIHVVGKPQLPAKSEQQPKTAARTGREVTTRV
jgi:hypothetical protein